MQAESRFPYELFISYSRKDSPWVLAELLPRLESWGVAYCIDFKDFTEGRPVAEELGRLVGLSRQTLIVLSANWLSTPFTDYELQLTSDFESEDDVERFLPLRIDDCETPETLLRFQIIERSRLGWPAAWEVLYATLVASRIHGERLLASEIELAKSASEGTFVGYEYLANVLVANISPGDLRFDAVELVFSHYGDEFHGCAKAMRIVPDARGNRRFISYHGSGYFNSLRSIARQESSAHLEPVMLEQFRGVRINNIGFGYSPVSVAGRNVIGASVQLMLGGKPVTHRCVCALPPVLRLPDFRSERAHRLTLASERFIPSPSGALDGAVVDRAIPTAAAHDPDSLLVSVSPTMISTHILTGGDAPHSCDGWHFTFYSDRLGSTFEIRSSDPTWLDEGRTQQAAARPRCWLSKSLLETCRVDCDLAYLIARGAGASPQSEGGKMSLECGLLEGRWRPVWNLPFLLGEKPLGVLADTCEVALGSGGRWTKPDGIIWNA